MLSTIALTSLLASSAAARALGFPPPPTVYSYCVVVDPNPENVAGDTWQVGGHCNSGDSMGITETHTVTNTWTVGGDLGLSFDNIIEKVLGGSVGASASYSHSTGDGTGETTTAKCPENGAWTCSLVVEPGMKKITGHIEEPGEGGCKGGAILQHSSKKPNYGAKYENVAPRVDKSGNGAFSPTICACKNKASWADNGAPTLVCPEEC